MLEKVFLDPFYAPIISYSLGGAGASQEGGAGGGWEKLQRLCFQMPWARGKSRNFVNSIKLYTEFMSLHTRMWTLTPWVVIKEDHVTKKSFSFFLNVEKNILSYYRTYIHSKKYLNK